MSEKAENVQRKTLTDLQKAGELLIRTTVRKCGCFGRKQEEMRTFASYCATQNQHISSKLF